MRASPGRRLRRFGGGRDDDEPCAGRIGDRPERGAKRPSADPISQRLRDDLSKADFTSITIMPSSFLVRAKDSQGNPVMMVINPNSLTEVTQQSEQPMSGTIKGEPNSQIPAPTAKSTTPPAKQ